MSSRNLFSAVALATLASLAACGGGEASDDNAGGASQASSIGGIGGSGSSTQSIGGIGGSGSSTQSIGGIGGSGASTQSVGGIGGSGATTQSIGGSGATTQSVGGIGGTGATTQSIGGIGGSGKMTVAAVRGCGLQSVNVTVAGVRVNANGAADLGSEGWVDIALPVPVRVDLLALVAGGALPVDMSTLPDGTYRQMRLLLVADDASEPLADSVVSASHVETALAVPGAAAGGLPMAVAITVAGGQVSASYRNLDVCQAVSAGAGTFALGSVTSGATQVASAD